jgi:hypothetical protein
MVKLTKKQSKSYLLPAASYAGTAGLILNYSRRTGEPNAWPFGVMSVVVSGACLLVYSTRKTNFLVDTMVPKWLYGIKK